MSGLKSNHLQHAINKHTSLVGIIKKKLETSKSKSVRNLYNISPQVFYELFKVENHDLARVVYVISMLEHSFYDDGEVWLRLNPPEERFERIKKVVAERKGVEYKRQPTAYDFEIVDGWNEAKLLTDDQVYRLMVASEVVAIKQNSHEKLFYGKSIKELREIEEYKELELIEKVRDKVFNDVYDENKWNEY